MREEDEQVEYKLFNKQAMENLSTPEQLDQQVKIIAPGVWALFGAIVVGIIAAVVWVIIGTVSSGTDYTGVIFDHSDVFSLNAKLEGILQDVLVDEGETVSKGDIVAVISNDQLVEEMEKLQQEQAEYEVGSEEYLQLENRISEYNGKRMLRSNVDGVVQKIQRSKTAVNAGDSVATIVPKSLYSYNEVYIYVPKEEVGALEVGMEAQITPSYVTREEYGYMEGVISYISDNIVTENSLMKHMGTMDYVESLLPSQNCVEVTIQLSVDTEGEGNYVWSNPKGNRLTIKSGDQCSVHILKQEYHPYELLMSN